MQNKEEIANNKRKKNEILDRIEKTFLFLIIFNGTLCSLHCSIKECFLVLFKKKKYADEMRCIKSDIVSLRRKESVERKEAEKRREVYTVRK